MEAKRPTAVSSNNALTQLFQLPLQLFASPRSRPVLQRRLTGHVVRHAHLLPTPSPALPSCGSRPAAPSGLTSGFLARPRGWSADCSSPLSGCVLLFPTPPLTGFPPATWDAAAGLCGRWRGRRRRAWVSRACCWVTGPLRAAARAFQSRLASPSRTSGAWTTEWGWDGPSAGEAKEMGIPPRCTRSGCLRSRTLCVFEETGSSWWPLATRFVFGRSPYTGESKLGGPTSLVFGVSDSLEPA